MTRRTRRNSSIPSISLAAINAAGRRMRDRGLHGDALRDVGGGAL